MSQETEFAVFSHPKKPQARVLLDPSPKQVKRYKKRGWTLHGDPTAVMNGDGGVSNLVLAALAEAGQKKKAKKKK